MTIDQKSISPFVAQAECSRFSHRSYPEAVRPKFVLPVQLHHATRALSIFCANQKRLKLFAQWALSRCLLLKRPLYFEETRLMSQLKTVAGAPESISAISLGTPGPYNKQSVLLLSKNGLPLSITKVGTNESTRDLLQNEAAWLKTINNSDTLAGQVPELVQTSASDSVYLLTQTVNTGTPSANKLSKKHVQFLSALQQIKPTASSFIGSKMHVKMLNRSRILRGKISEGWKMRIDRALTIVESGLDNIEIPMVVAQRDFAYWNIKTTRHAIFVFDWEYASDEYIPLYDIFHFLVMPLAMKKEMNTGDINDILEKTGTIGSSLSEGHSKIKNPEVQLLAYLLDVCLFYLESNEGKSEGDIVVEKYSVLIDKLCI